MRSTLEKSVTFLKKKKKKKIEFFEGTQTTHEPDKWIIPESYQNKFFQETDIVYYWICVLLIRIIWVIYVTKYEEFEVLFEASSSYENSKWSRTWERPFFGFF